MGQPLIGGQPYLRRGVGQQGDEHRIAALTQLGDAAEPHWRKAPLVVRPAEASAAHLIVVHVPEGLLLVVRAEGVGPDFEHAREKLGLAFERRRQRMALGSPMRPAERQGPRLVLDRDRRKIQVLPSLLASEQLLSPEATRYAMDTLALTRSGPKRLRGGVPPDWKIYHKTGTGQVLGPISTGYNDVAILEAPDGARYAVAVMIGKTTAAVPDRMKMMQASKSAKPADSNSMLRLNTIRVIQRRALCMNTVHLKRGLTDTTNRFNASFASTACIVNWRIDDRSEPDPTSPIVTN